MEETMDVWGKLWDLAIECEGFMIELNPDTADRVTLVSENGDRSAVYWDNGDWHFEEELNRCPGDVAARDSF
jgi:hypothetical protein